MREPRRCVRCGAEEPMFPVCAACNERHEEFGECVGEEELPPFGPIEADEWCSAQDRKNGVICPDCATQAEKWANDDRCARCGASDPLDEIEDVDEWLRATQERGEWLRVATDDCPGGVCPACHTPHDAERELEFMAMLEGMLSEHGLHWDDSVVSRAVANVDEAERLAGAGPEALLAQGDVDG